MRPPYALQHRRCSTRPKTSRLKKAIQEALQLRHSTCCTACSLGHGFCSDTDRPIHHPACMPLGHRDWTQRTLLFSPRRLAGSSPRTPRRRAAPIWPRRRHRCAYHNCTGTGLTPATSTPGQTHFCHIGAGTLSIWSGLTRAWARPSHICTETGRRHSRCNWTTFKSVRRCSTRERLSWMGARSVPECVERRRAKGESGRALHVALLRIA